MTELVRTLCSWCPTVIVDVPATDGKLSHGICPECYAVLVADLDEQAA